MKKAITAILTVIMLICVLPITASAKEVLKAPTVQYKLINHDEIALRWSSVEGADGYYIYRKDVATGKTARTTKLIKDTSYNVTGLTPSTEYIFKVAAVNENEGHINIGEKSKGTKLTTPDEWYYYFPHHMYFETDDLKCDLMMRKHFNNTGSEVFNMVYINEEVVKKASYVYEDTIFYTSTSNIDEYVYFEFWYSLSENSASSYLCRMKNDGSDFEIVMKIGEYDKYDIFTDSKNGMRYIYVIANDNKNFLNLGDYNVTNEYFENFKEKYTESQLEDMSSDDWWIYECINDCNSGISIFYYDSDNKFHKKYRWYEEEKASFSGLARDDKYIYFFSEPLYNITDKTDTIVYRAKYDGSDLQEMLIMPKDNSFIYGDPNNGSMKLFGCDEDYLYYYAYGRKANEESRENYYTFYRISIKEKNAVPQKIISVDDLSFPYNSSVELCNGYLYIETYIYDNNYNRVPIYVRIGTNGKGLKKQDKPFEWRY